MGNESTDIKIRKWPKEYNTDIPNVTLAEYILEQIVQYEDDIACIDSETKTEVRYSDIVKRTKALAVSLRKEFNLGAGAVVAIALPTCPDYVVSFLAVNLCGATATLVNPLQTIPELEHAVKLANPTLWIGVSLILGKYKEIYQDATERPVFISIDGEDSESNVRSFTLLIEAGLGKGLETCSHNAQDSVAAILYSSGTTGVPKGVMLTNRNFLAMRRQSEELGGFPRNPDNSTLLYMPLHHSTAFNLLFECLMRGLRFILVARYSMDRLLSAIQDYKVNILFLVPSIATQLLKQPVEERYDLSSLRIFYCGTAPIGMDTIAGMKAKFRCPLFQMYGMTETTVRTHGNDLTLHRDGSIGIPLPFTEVKIVDLTTGEELGPNQEGELYIRGPLIMKGYIGDDESTKHTVDPDGWLHSGDIGFYDDDGFFFITGRVKELIKFKGHQVSPSELEQILLRHPEVLDAAVGPVPDEIAGELPRAYVVRRTGATVNEEALVQYVSDQVSAHKRLRGGVKFTEALPKTQTGKIMRGKLKFIE